MNVSRARIESVFGKAAFPQAMFYARPGGLRFELSEGQGAIAQFLSAMHKSLAICADIFDGRETMTVCLSRCVWAPASGLRDTLRALGAAGIRIPRERAIWIESERQDDDEPTHRIFVAFEAPTRFIQRLLWCALSSDLPIEPRPYCRVYLLECERRIMAHPCDDRGMDVVGADQDLLSALHSKYDRWLLDYDRAAMDATFVD